MGVLNYAIPWISPCPFAEVYKIGKIYLKQDMNCSTKKSNVKKINNCARIHFANKTFYYLMFNQIIILIYSANACFQN